MPDSLDYFAHPPAWAFNQQAGDDALSDVLQTVRLRGGGVVRSNDRQTPSHAYPSGQRLLHIVEQGELRLEFDSPHSPLVLSAGDLAVLVSGTSHAVLPRPDTRWITGTLLMEQQVADPLFAALPAAIVVHSQAGGQDWLPLSTDLLLAELLRPRPGSQVMVSRILDLLFIHALRAWADDREDLHPGWLAGALDTSIGAVLAALHQHLDRNWTVTAMAGVARMSRASFAARFTSLLGEPPGAYLQRLRLNTAAELLRATSEPVGSIGRKVGYTSEAAFSRAFTRRFQRPPRAWRTTC